MDSADRLPDPPTWLLRALEPTGVEPATWQRGLAPAYIGLFLWVALFDRIPAELLGRAGFLPAVVGCGIAAGLCYLFFYLPPALLGNRSGRGFLVVSAGAFGVRGAPWTAGLVYAVQSVILIAVSVGYGTTMVFRALGLLGLLGPDQAGPLPPAAGFERTMPFLVTAAAWGLATTLVGGYLVRLIVALMSVYPFVPAVVLGLTTVLALPGLPRFDPSVLIASDAPAGGPLAFWAMATATQMILGVFAPAALSGADWGAATRSPADVRRGGVVCVALAGWTVATLAILTVAGVAGLMTTPARLADGPPIAAGYLDALISLLGPRLAGAVLLPLALTALAPACYAGHFLFAWLHDWRPILSRVGWTIVGLGVALVLIATGWAFRLRETFVVLGAIGGPVVGVLAAESVMGRGRWRGVRRGFHIPGLLGWAIGLGVGLVPLAASPLRLDGLPTWHPWTLYAYGAAFLVDLLLCLVGLGAPRVEVSLEATPAATESPDAAGG